MNVNMTMNANCQVRRYCPVTSCSGFSLAVNSLRPFTDLMERLHDIYHYARQHLKVASDRMKAWLRPPGQLRTIAGRPSLTVDQSHLSTGNHGKTHTEGSLGSTTWSSRPIDILGEDDMEGVARTQGYPWRHFEQPAGCVPRWETGKRK
jgi:hypothetical protein